MQLEPTVARVVLRVLARTQVAAMHDRIRLPHADTSRTVAWNDLYVRPRLSVSVDKQAVELDVSDLIAPGRRYVILGDPGAGKSTLANKIAYDVATSETDKRVPFLVTLRDLSAEIAKGGRPLTDYLAMVSAAPYNVRVTPDLIEYLLHNSRSIVILDGLDELTDHKLRGQLVSLVEGFARMYPLVSIVVTSRRVGSEHAARSLSAPPESASSRSPAILPPSWSAPVPPVAQPIPVRPASRPLSPIGLDVEWPPDEIASPSKQGGLSERRAARNLPAEAVALDARVFPVVSMMDFGTDQVTSYAQKWFALEHAIPVNERGRMCRSFLRESDTIRDLRSNPLLLSLLCSTYASEQYLPRNRAQIYEKCALMLFEGRDRRRGIVGAGRNRRTGRPGRPAAGLCPSAWL